MLAVSAREAWIPAEDGLWHVRDGTSTTVPVAGWTSPMRAFDVDLAPDGTLAVATDKGTAVLRDGRWTVLGREEAQAVTIASDGAIWVGERAVRWRQTTVASFRLDGRTWVRNALPAIVAEGASPSLVILPSDGEAWLLSRGWVPMLHRFDGTGWTRGSQLGEYHLGDIRGLALAPNGDLVALASAYDGTDWTVARYDGALWTVEPRLRRARAARERTWSRRDCDRSRWELVGGHRPRPGPLRRPALESPLRGRGVPRPLLRPRRHPVGRRSIGRAAPSGRPPGRA